MKKPDKWADQFAQARVAGAVHFLTNSFARSPVELARIALDAGNTREGTIRWLMNACKLSEETAVEAAKQAEWAHLVGA